MFSSRFSLEAGDADNRLGMTARPAGPVVRVSSLIPRIGVVIT